MRFLIIAGLTLGVILRVWQLATPVSHSDVADLDRESLLQSVEATSGALQPYCFDAQAPIVLGTGPDGAPGFGGEDDNFNGKVDERSEIGAVGSDDTCLAPADDGYLRSLEAPDSLVLSRGAFVPCENAADAARFRVPGLGWLIGPFDTQPSPRD